MKHSALTEDTLAVFLDAFYAKVRRDPLLGPVFSQKIPDAEWPRHIARIQDLWSSVLLKTGRYRGNPFGKHLGIAGIDLPHFERWLGLFAETAREAFVPEIAEALIERAHRIGDSLKAGLFFRIGEPRSALGRRFAADEPKHAETDHETGGRHSEQAHDLCGGHD